MALGEVARTAREHPERAVQAGEQLVRREDGHARGGQLDGERHAVDPCADRLDARAVRARVVVGRDRTRRAGRTALRRSRRAAVQAAAAARARCATAAGWSPARASAAPARAAPRRSRRRRRVARSCRARAASGAHAAAGRRRHSSERPSPSSTPSAAAIAGSSPSGSRTPASDTSQTPPSKADSSPSAAAAANRVLPVPPRPRIVTRRSSPVSRATQRVDLLLAADEPPRIRREGSSVAPARSAAAGSRWTAPRRAPAARAAPASGKSLSRCSPRSISVKARPQQRLRRIGDEDLAAVTGGRHARGEMDLQPAVSPCVAVNEAGVHAHAHAELADVGGHAWSCSAAAPRSRPRRPRRDRRSMRRRRRPRCRRHHRPRARQRCAAACCGRPGPAPTLAPAARAVASSPRCP